MPHFRLTALTFREKSIAIQIVAIILILGGVGLRYSGEPLTRIESVGLLVIVTLAMILVTAVGHIAIAIRHKPEPLDERDRLVELRGSRNAYVILAVIIWGALLLGIVQTPSVALFPIILAGFAVAELVRLGSTLFYYWHGA